MHHLLPLLVALPLLGAALLAACGRLVPRPVAEGAACAVAAGTAVLAVLLLTHSSPPLTEWVGGWEPVAGHSVG
ncbi:NADH-quinone oxidoreductase subunit D, partial [Streptomyces sp. SID5926]|nr:NADH-quinone oxidoreductase subunit D [Streptomyces sp. SID5926]